MWKYFLIAFVLALIQPEKLNAADTMDPAFAVNTVKETVGHFVSGFGSICKHNKVSINEADVRKELEDCMIPLADTIIKQNMGATMKDPVKFQKLQSYIKSTNPDELNIGQDMKDWIKTEYIGPNCKQVKVAIDCINPSKLSTMKACMAGNTGSFDTSFRYAELLIEAGCKDDGQQIFDIIESGFGGCGPQLSNNAQRCFQAAQPKLKADQAAGYKTAAEVCSSIETVHKCAMDVGSPNVACKKEAIDAFHSAFSKVNDWVAAPCMDSGSTSVLPTLSAILTVLALVVSKLYD